MDPENGIEMGRKHPYITFKNSLHLPKCTQCFGLAGKFILINSGYNAKEEKKNCSKIEGYSMRETSIGARQEGKNCAKDLPEIPSWCFVFFVETFVEARKTEVRGRIMQN